MLKLPKIRFGPEEKHMEELLILELKEEKTKIKTNKQTIILLGLAGYIKLVDYSQLWATRLVGYLSLHFKCALVN